MDNIRKILIDKLISSKLDRYPTGLFHGKMGLCIYFYHLSKIQFNPDYQSMAEQLLDQIPFRDFTPNCSIAVKDGLAGVGLGLTYLVKNRFVDGDLNELLESVDNTIYRRIAFLENPSDFSPTVLLHLTGYLYIRLKDQTEKNVQTIYKDLIIKVLNMFYEQIDDEFMNEYYTFSFYHYQLPVFFWVVSKLLEAGFYNERIYKMLDTLQRKILSRFPLLHSNRLFLLWGMLNLRPYLNHALWINYIQLLYREISLDEILDNELNGREIFISNGLSGTYILLHAINSNFPEYQIPFDPPTIYTKMQKSDAWSALMERDYFYKIHHGLLNGFPGVELVLSHIKQHYLINE